MNPMDWVKLVSALKVAEGLKLKAYQDTEGVWTIGFGTNLQELTITEGLALDWLHDKLRAAERDANTFPWYVRLDGVRQRAVVELLYNLGLPRFRLFRNAIRAIARSDWEVAASEFADSKWARQVGPTRSGRIIDMIRTGRKDI